MDQYRRRRPHRIGVDLRRLYLQVWGTGPPVEVERKVVGRKDLAECDRGRVFVVGRDIVVVDAQRGELGADELAERVVTDTGDQRRAVAQTRRGHRDVGRAAAEEFAERFDVLQSDADLQGIDVDATAPDGEDVNWLRGTQDQPFGSRNCSLSRVPRPQSVLSIVCPDILTFSHAMLGCGYSFVWSQPEIGEDVPLTVELDRSSPVPLYYQLAQAIEAAIRDGDLSPGDRFENELALAKRLTLSRPTTRRAIQELVDKGLLVRKRGVGTQVVQSPVHRRVELTSLFDDLARAGQEPTTQLLEYRAGPPDEEVARELNLADDREVVAIHRLRCANGEPLAVMINHLPAEIAPGPDELESNGLYQSLWARGVHISAGPAAHRRQGAPPPVGGPGCWTRSPTRRC